MTPAYLEHIVSRADVCGGKPCIRGTRMRVRDVLEYMAGGDTAEDLVAEFPFITRANIMACLAFAADHADFPVLAAAE